MLLDKLFLKDLKNVGMEKSRADEERMLRYLHVYFGLFNAYLNELASKTKSDLVPDFKGVTNTVVLSEHESSRKDAPPAAKV